MSGAAAWRRVADGLADGAAVADVLRRLPAVAVLAPSGHNTQPWMFRVSGAAVDVFADRRRALPAVDPQDRELTISCGAAVAAMEVALGRAGYAAVVHRLPDPADADHLARLEAGPRRPPSAEDVALFEAIPERRTNRRDYDGTPMPPGLEARCREAAARHGATLTILGDGNARARIAALVAEGDRRQFADPAFRRELADWIRSHRLGSRDGISAAAFGLPDVLSAVGAAAIRRFDLGRSVADSDARKVTRGSRRLALLATAADDPPAWIDAGRALMRILLLLTAEGFTAAYLNQPIEVAALRPRLREAAEAAGHPQLLLRIGRGPAVPPAARRPPEAVLLS